MKHLVKFTSDEFEAAGYIFEQMHKHTPDEFEIDFVRTSGLTKYKIDDLKSLIVAGIESGLYNETDLRISAYWSLSKTFDKGLITYFRKWLFSETNKNEATAVFQILIALDKLDEPVFPPKKTSRSWDEFEINLNYAKKYLAKLE